MVKELAPVLVLLTAALFVFGSMNVTRRLGITKGVGCGVALCIIAIAIGMSPEKWRGAWGAVSGGDNLLSYARIVGISGMFFLAGTRFSLAPIYLRLELFVRTIIAAAVFFGLVLLAAKILGMGLNPIVLLPASATASSLWFIGESHRSDDNKPSYPWQLVVLIVSAGAFLVVYFFDALPRTTHRSVSLYVIVVAYEVVKLFVLFGFAYLISSRFLARAQHNVSATRVTIGFVLLAVLIFGLTLITTNELGAMAWAFIAGALWQRSQIGMKFGETERPIATALLISLVFVPLMMQTHGRELTELPRLVTFVAVVFLTKLVLAKVLVKSSTLPMRKANQLVLALVSPGEIAIALLGFAVTRWPIDGQTYFAILGYALVANLLIPTLQVIVRGREAEEPAKPKALIYE